MPTAARILAVALSCFAGCATQPYPTTTPGAPSQSPAQPSAQRPPPPVNLSGYSPAFKQGYSDGCSSARGSMRRDEARFRSDNDYMMGWGDGNSVCRTRR